jgi:hypothetical protein
MLSGRSVPLELPRRAMAAVKHARPGRTRAEPVRGAEGSLRLAVPRRTTRVPRSRRGILALRADKGGQQST